MNINNQNTKRLRPKQVSFKSENLVVDYITINISIDDPFDPELSSKYSCLAEYLCLCGFNSTFKKNEDAKAEEFLSNKTNRHKVNLIKCNSNPRKKIFWNGLAVRPPGYNGKYFYSLLKQDKVKFEEFPFPGKVIRLGRFDLYYMNHILVPEKNNRSSVEKFLMNCKEKYENKKLPGKAKVTKTKTGFSFRAVDRKESTKFFRIYEKFKSLRFELEMQRKLIRLHQNSFFSYSLEEFENELVQVFCQEFVRFCVIEFNYSDWLVKRLRNQLSIKKLENFKIGRCKALVSPYNLRFAKNKESSFHCLQLLSFIQSQKVNIDLRFMESLELAILEFALVDLIEFMGKNKTSTHQRKKAFKLLDTLLELEPLKIKVSSSKFQKFNFCSFVELEKRKGKWFVTLRVAVKVLSSIYPYTLSDTLLIYKKKFELEINSQFIESFNTKNSWKEFEIDKTYKNISLSNLAIERRQSIIINKLNGLKNENRIESKIRISSRGKDKSLIETVEIKNLTPKRLKNASKIFFKESYNFLK